MDYGKKTKEELIADLEMLHRQLEQSGKAYYALTHFNANEDGIVFCAMDGTIKDANPAYLNMLGYTLDEAQSLSYQQITPRKWWSMESELRESQVMKRGFCDVYEKEYIRKDGTVIPISTQAWLVRDEGGRPWRLLGFVREKK